jgi:hypothetical protein
MPAFKPEFEARALRHKVTPRYLALYLLRPVGKGEPIALRPLDPEGERSDRSRPTAISRAACACKRGPGRVRRSRRLDRDHGNPVRLPGYESIDSADAAKLMPATSLGRLMLHGGSSALGKPDCHTPKEEEPVPLRLTAAVESSTLRFEVPLVERQCVGRQSSVLKEQGVKRFVTPRRASSNRADSRRDRAEERQAPSRS